MRRSVGDVFMTVSTSPCGVGNDAREAALMVWLGRLGAERW